MINCLEKKSLPPCVRPDRIIAIARNKTDYSDPCFLLNSCRQLHPKSAGTIARVDEINVLIDRVAAEKVTLESRGLQAFFKAQALNADLTIDGVHLNSRGLDIYRKLLLNVLNSP